MIDPTVQAVANYFKMEDGNWFVKKFSDLTGDEGVKAAEKYLEWAKRGQQNCISDFSYYAYQNDQKFARMMIQVFTFTKTGKCVREIPRPPEIDRESIPKTQHGTPLWSRRWTSGGTIWITCLFEHLNGKEQQGFAKAFIDKTDIKIEEK